MSIKKLEAENEKLIEELSKVEIEEEQVESEIRKTEIFLSSYGRDIREIISENPITESPMTITMNYNITYNEEPKS